SRPEFRPLRHSQSRRAGADAAIRARLRLRRHPRQPGQRPPHPLRPPHRRHDRLALKGARPEREGLHERQPARPRSHRRRRGAGVFAPGAGAEDDGGSHHRRRRQYRGGDAVSRTLMTQTASAAALRAKIDVHRPAIAMAAHNPLAAKLAANAGFDAIWGSGFELSASFAVPDASILSMSTHLDMMRAIAAVQDAPVIADLDTGFGNAVNVAYVVPQYAAAGVAAVVIEDKTFPKETSLRPGGRQELVPISEFQGKVAASKAAGSVLVIARTEALIAGRGQEEALRRGAAYAEAGA